MFFNFETIIRNYKYLSHFEGFLTLDADDVTNDESSGNSLRSSSSFGIILKSECKSAFFILSS